MASDSSKPADSVNALKAMAGGADLDAKKESHAENLTPNAIDAILAEGGTLPPSGQVDPDAPESAAFEAAAPQVSRVAMQARAKAAGISQFGKFLIPLLVVFGFAMVAIAIIAFVFSDTQELLETDKAILPPEGRYLAYIAGPLGVILLLGAWWFWLELKKSAKRFH